LVPRVVFYETTDSTNLRAREYARVNPDSRTPTVFIADGQTAGRGRRGRSFESPAGSGLYLSFLVYPKSKGADATAITAYSAVKLAEALEECAPLSAGIKWVNDIIVGGRKIAGILAEAEMSSEGEIGCIVVGMGINVYKNALSDELSSIATSVEEETGERISREELAAELIIRFLSRCYDFTVEEILPEYRRRSTLIGEEITVHALSGEEYPARAVGIDSDLSLRVQTYGGEEKSLISATVSVRKK